MSQQGWEKWWWHDWLSAPDLTPCDPATRGIWMDFLGAMWVGKRSKLTGTADQLARIARCTSADIERFMEDAQSFGFCDISVTRNGAITVSSRRRHRQETAKRNNTLRQQRHRRNAKVTHTEAEAEAEAEAEKERSRSQDPSQDLGSGASVTDTSTEILSDLSQEPPLGVVGNRGGMGGCKKLSTGSEAESQEPAATRPAPPAAPASVSLPDGLDRKAWDDYESHRRAIKARKLKPASIERQARWLVEQGPPEIQREIVDQTIRNAWTGLFELKANGARPAMSAIDKLKASGWIDDNETGTTLEGEYYAEETTERR